MRDVPSTKHDTQQHHYCYQQGVPLKIVQETLGNATITLTADLYGHLMPGDKDKVTEAMGRALGA